MTTRIYDAATGFWRIRHPFEVSKTNMPVTRTNLSIAPRAIAGSQGYRSNNGASWTASVNNAITGHPLGITTAARVIPVGTATNSVASIYGVDGRDVAGNITVSRAFGVWVYSNRALNVTCYMLDNQAATTKTTAVPAATWTWVTTSAAFTGHSILGATTTSGNAVIGTDYLLVTGSISETTVPPDFFDGAYASSTGVTYAWTGTAGLSTSTLAVGVWEENTGGSRFLGLDGIGSPFSPNYIGAGTIWQRDVTYMPLASNSASLATWMWNETPTPYNNCSGGASGAFGSKTSFNTSSFGTAPIVTAVVDSTDPYCQFQFIDSCSLPNGTTAESTAYILGKIPWPVGLLPPTGGDKGLAIFDRGTGIIREYFGTTPVAGKPGHWTAATGGYSLAKPHFKDLATTNYPTQLKAGSSAVVLMHNHLGFIGADEVRQGKINHAIAFTMANATCTTPASWPAVWSDGKFPNASWSGWGVGNAANRPYPGPSPRHGQWGRIPVTVDPMFNPVTGLPYNPMTRLLIAACQKYGLVGTDTNAFVHAFNCESGAREKMITGVDPWVAGGELAQLLNPSDTSQAFNVSDFPWNLTQWAPVDWGRPNPDFKLRPDENSMFEPHGGA